jgi:hypothetical protein
LRPAGERNGSADGATVCFVGNLAGVHRIGSFDGVDHEPVGVPASAGSPTVAPIAVPFKKKFARGKKSPQSMVRDDCRFI